MVEKSAIVYNTITTPVSGEFQVVLADGTKVWLNSSSSLRYPSAFTGSERDVTLTGEAYFEVAQNKFAPFIVKTTHGGSVKVLGTHFDIMDYSNEPAMKTTLLEGLVAVENGSVSKQLKPGEQAILPPQGTLKIIQGADIEEAVAWKNGLFQFDHADLQTILRQVSRWYGVEVVYQGDVQTEPLKGMAPRNVNLSKLLEGISEMTGVRFKMDGNRLIVSK
jgi:ferric-dicitrate binding protein FerR (iron transport regulator)